MDYMEDAKWEVLNYLKNRAVDISELDESEIDEMAYRYYKNYYSYEIENEFAIEDAVKTVIRDF